MNKILIYLVSIIIGSGLGYLVYKFIGCRSGSCPITSNPYMSILIGALFAVLLVSDHIDKLVR